MGGLVILGTPWCRLVYTLVEDRTVVSIKQVLFHSVDVFLSSKGSLALRPGGGVRGMHSHFGFSPVITFVYMCWGSF